MKSIIMSLLVVIAVAGCNTGRGIGQDVERSGEAIQEGIADIAD